MVDATKMKKEFELDTLDNFTYSYLHKWDKVVEKYLSSKFNLKGVPLIYVITRDEFTDRVNFTDEIYKFDPYHCRMITTSLTDTVYKRDNSEVHKFLKYLTQVTEA